MKALADYSPKAKVFVLIHKMDLVPQERRKEVFDSKVEQLKSKAGKEIKCFETSIWEASLYNAWNKIVFELTSNAKEVEVLLKNFAEACEADEAILFEKNTFLLCCCYSNKNILDEQRFEKISHIIKKFKLSCMSCNSEFQSMVIQTKNFTCYLDELTSSTCIMVILSNKNINIELVKLNSSLCKKSFEEKLKGKS